MLAGLERHTLLTGLIGNSLIGIAGGRLIHRAAGGVVEIGIHQLEVMQLDISPGAGHIAQGHIEMPVVALLRHVDSNTADL